MTNVASLAEHVAKRKARLNPPILPTTSEAFERAWSAYPDIGRKRSSRALSWPVWCKALFHVNEDTLEAATRSFASDPDEKLKECGAPGFHRWLRDGRWENWLKVESPTPLAAVERRFPDEALREAFFERFSDERARRWFDRSKWDEDTRTFFWAWAPKADWCERMFMPWCEFNDIRAVRAARAP